MGCIGSKSEDDISENIIDINGFGPNYKGDMDDFMNLCENIKAMSYADQFQKVYELTFPNNEYQPMSPDFTDTHAYYKAINRFIYNLESVSSIYCTCTSSDEYSWFQYSLTKNNEALDEFESFIKSHCLKNIVITYERLNNGSLFLRSSESKNKN